MTRCAKFAAAGMTALSIAVLAGAGIANADAYAGETYGDAAGKLSEAGKKAVVSSRAGDTLPRDKCVVTHSESAPWLKGDAFTPVTDTVLLDINCNATVATAKDPGNSAASPQGRQAIKEANAKKKQS